MGNLFSRRPSKEQRRGIIVKKILKIMAPVLVLIVSVGVVQAMIAAKPTPEKKEESQRLVSLYVDEVRSDIVTLSVNTQGEARPHTEIDLVPQVSGRIVSLATNFAVGAGFEPGQTLIKIDDSDYKLAVIRAEARVAEANVRLMQAHAAATIKRQQWQSTAKGGKPSPLQVNRPQVIEAEANLRSAEADLAEASLNLERTEIQLPFRGRIMERNIGVGQFVTMGSKLGRVFSTDIMEIRLPLTDEQLVELNLPMGYVDTNGNGPQVALRAEVGGEDHVWQGRIVRTHAAVDQQTRLIYAVAQVSDPYGDSHDIPLAAGMFVAADIQGVNSQPALVMPREALRNADQVYVINDDDRLEIRTVDVLSTSMDQVLVTSGVTAGERVVTSTIASAVDGMLVVPLARLALN
jgi:RND family efflux transporter MFP subunit